MKEVLLINVQDGNSELPYPYGDPFTKELANALEVQWLIPEEHTYQREKYSEKKQLNQEDIKQIKEITRYIFAIVNGYRKGHYGNLLQDRKEGVKSKVFSTDKAEIRDKAIAGCISFFQKEAQEPSKHFIASWIVDFENYLPKQEGEEINYSKPSAVEKVIYLHKLGILNFLKEQPPFNMSTNSMAKVLSRITGENISTLQSYINPIDNPGTNQKNNPLLKSKKVEAVKRMLIEMGFKPFD